MTRTDETDAPAGKLGRFGLYIFLGALALAPLLGGTPSGSDFASAGWGGDSMLGALRALVFAALLLASVTGGGSPVSSRLGMVARAGVFGAAAWVVLSLIGHTHFFTSQVYAFAMIPEALNWLTYAGAFALAARFAREDRRYGVWMAAALLVGGAVCAIVGVRSFGTVPTLERALHRESATFFSPNFAAGFAALTLPLAAALFLVAESLVPLLLSASAVGLLFALIMTTGSRAGLALALVGLAIALGLTVLRRVRIDWKRVGALVGVLAVCGFLFRAPIVGRVSAGSSAAAASDAGADQGGDHSGAFRKETWKGTLAMARAHPVFGAGPGTFPYTYERYAIVGRSGHAHSSYLQLASESGFPALALALLGIAASLVLALQQRGRTVAEQDSRGLVVALLGPALVGGIVASLGRNVFDSEWIVLGCGLPFFAALGMLVGSSEPATESSHADKKPAMRIASALFALVCLALALWLRSRETFRDNLQAMGQKDPMGTASAARDAERSFGIGDPQLSVLAQDLGTAATLSPSGKRLYQLARYYERQGDEQKAIGAFEASVAAEPLNLQTLKALAEAQAKTGDAADSLATYRRMIAVTEGPAGTIRAIPELPDTLPAFAYTAVAEDAAHRGDVAEALKNFTTAERIIEDYSRTPIVYQVSEIVTLGANTMTRRAEVRSLYTDRIIPGLVAALKASGRASDADALLKTESETTARLDAFEKPPTGFGGT